MSDNWAKFLKREIRGLDKLLVLGTGNALKADDAAGLLVASLLDRKLGRRQKSRIKVLRVYELMNTYKRRIKRLRPSHLIIIDALEMRKRPGSIIATRLEPGSRQKKKISSEFYQFLEILTGETACRIYFVGIQPESLDFGHPITPAIKETCRLVADYISTMAS